MLREIMQLEISIDPNSGDFCWGWCHGDDPNLAGLRPHFLPPHGEIGPWARAQLVVDHLPQDPNGNLWGDSTILSSLIYKAYRQKPEETRITMKQSRVLASQKISWFATRRSYPRNMLHPVDDPRQFMEKFWVSWQIFHISMQLNPINLRMLRCFDKNKNVVSPATK